RSGGRTPGGGGPAGGRPTAAPFRTGRKAGGGWARGGRWRGGVGGGGGEGERGGPARPWQGAVAVTLARRASGRPAAPGTTLPRSRAGPSRPRRPPRA